MDDLVELDTVARWLRRRGFTILRSDTEGILVACLGFQDCNALYHVIVDDWASFKAPAQRGLV
ncbi:MAG: hypothetical protein C4534_10230 [Gaiellales bacterium]|nr:MAG: hypothetical protein C4534_10230 [Gaiellales bacterium]